MIWFKKPNPFGMFRFYLHLYIYSVVIEDERPL